MGKIIKRGISYGGSGGSNNYNDLSNQPSINNITLVGNKSLGDLGINIPTRLSDLVNDEGFIASIDSETPPFTEAQSRTNIASGDTISIILGKIAKFFTDLANVAFSGSYNDLTDQPTIPIVNNATITIQKNGTDVDNFTTNSASAKSINITVPTKVSELTNDSGYTTNIGTVTQVKIGTSEYNPTNGVVSLPNYPTVNNAILTIQKNGTTVNTFTANASSNVTANITVPTKTSDITNDSNFVASTSATWKNIVGAWSSAVQANVGATSVSVSNPMNSTNVTVDPFCENSSGTQIGIKTMSVTASTITLTFDALTVATTFKCRVMSN